MIAPALPVASGTDGSMHDESQRRAITDPIRLAALRTLALLDSPAEEAFDRLTRLAAQTIQVPIALVSLVDEERQFFKSCVGLAEPWATTRQNALTYSFCQYVVASNMP